MNWLGIAGLAASVGQSILGSSQNNRNIDKYLSAQAEENEKAYNRNVDFYKRAPTYFVQALKDAGLNPNLAYGQLGSAMSSMPQMQANDMQSMLNRQSLVSSGLYGAQQSAQIDLLRSQAEKNRADVRNTNAQTNSFETYNKYYEDILKGQLNEQNSRISLNWSQSDLNDSARQLNFSTMAQISKNIEKLGQETKNLSKEFDILSEEQAIKKIESYFASYKAKAELNLMYAQAKQCNSMADLTYQEFKEMCATAMYRLSSAQHENAQLALQGVILKKTGDLMDLQIDQAAYDANHKNLHEMERFIQSITGGLSSLASGYMMYGIGRQSMPRSMGRIGYR